MRYSPFRHLPAVFSRSRPVHLTYFVTRRCNGRCPFCFSLRSSTVREHAGGELTLNEIDRTARSLGNLLWLAFSGGEIHLREDLPEIARIFYRHNRPAIMLFPTNGMLPELIHEHIRDILQSCPRSIIAVKLSLDGVGAAHDALRETAGSFERTMQTYDLMRGLVREYPNFELGVNTVFCSVNQNAMDGIIDHVKGMTAIGTHTISLVRGDLHNEQFKAVDLASYERAIDRIERDLQTGCAPTYRFAGAGIKAAQDILQRKLILRTAREDRAVVDCYAGRLNLVLWEDGGLSPCELREDGFGNVRDHGYDIPVMVRTDRARALLSSISRTKCHCTHECNMMTNILFNPRWYPALSQELLLMRR